MNKCECGRPCRKKGTRSDGSARYDTRCQQCHRKCHGHKVSRPRPVAVRLRRESVIRHYGGCCSCCGEDEPSFLTIDHPGTTKTIIRWLIQNGLPGGFQVICWNCSRGRQVNGVCPHVRNRRKYPMAGITMAEMLQKKFKQKFTKSSEVGEHSDKNPLEARIGGVVTIDTVAEKDLFFTVKEVAHAVEEVGDKKIPFTDYLLVATPGGDDSRADESGKVRRVLRLLPVEEGDKFLQYNCVVFEQFYECDYDQARTDKLYDVDFTPPRSGDFVWPVLQDPNGEFNDFETGDKYTRCFRGFAGWESPHVVKYTVFRDQDGDGRVDESEIESGREMQFWDYEREVPVGKNGRKRVEYLNVEQDADGYFRLYRGRQVPQEGVVRL